MQLVQFIRYAMMIFITLDRKFKIRLFIQRSKSERSFLLLHTRFINSYISCLSWYELVTCRLFYPETFYIMCYLFYLQDFYNIFHDIFFLYKGIIAGCNLP